MNGSVRIGQLFGVPLRMHWTVPVLVVLFGYGLGRQTLPHWTPGHSQGVYTVASALGAIALVASLLLHEAAHAVVARRGGVRVEDVTLWALGGVTRMGRPPTARLAFWVAVSGPLASLAVAGAALGAGAGLHAAGGGAAVPAAVLAWLGWTNVLLAVFNLLPAIPMDGGRVLQAVLWWRTGDRERAARIADRGGQIIGIALIGLGWLAFVRGVPGGLWLAVIGFFVTVTAGAERRQATYATALRGVLVADAMSHPVVTGSDWLTVERFIADVAAPARHTALPLLNFNGDASGMVTTRQLAAVRLPDRGTLRVRDVATPLSQCTLAGPEEQLTDVLERARPAAALRILVLEDGRRPVGIITPHDIQRIVQRSGLDRAGRA